MIIATKNSYSEIKQVSKIYLLRLTTPDILGYANYWQSYRLDSNILPVIKDKNFYHKNFTNLIAARRSSEDLLVLQTKDIFNIIIYPNALYHYNSIALLPGWQFP